MPLLGPSLDSLAPLCLRVCHHCASPHHVQGRLGVVNATRRAVSPVDVSRDLAGGQGLPPDLAGRAMPCDQQGPGEAAGTLGAQGKIGGEPCSVCMLASSASLHPHLGGRERLAVTVTRFHRFQPELVIA